MDSLPVLVIGGGIGGLTLAHGLRHAGVPVRVFEKTHERSDWLQGYRIHINPAGARALRDCLPPAGWTAFTRAVSPGGGFGFLTDQGTDLLGLAEDEINTPGAGPADRHHGIGRIQLRTVLLEGLDLETGKTFISYEEEPDAVVAHFADGSSARGSALVGADGANSRVRAQLIPAAAARIDTGVLTIAGRCLSPSGVSPSGASPSGASPSGASPSGVSPSGASPVDESSVGALPVGTFMAGDSPGLAAAELPPSLLTRANVVIPRGRGSLFTAAWTSPDGDQVLWGYSDATARFPADVEQLAPDALLSLVRDRLRGWAPEFHRLIANSDPATVNAFRVKSATPVSPAPVSPAPVAAVPVRKAPHPPGEGVGSTLLASATGVPELSTGRVTLLGDAVHSMTPMAGVGANTALRDADLLRRKLSAAHAGEMPLLAAVEQYEREMLDYGFAAVRLSLRNARQAAHSTVISRALFRAVLRVIAAVPPARRRFARGLGD
ncbi:FAD-dependent monooxygenase [Actinoplanes solisilvae]|uniref:FAD-dependent monooxygenase n=1 Tax=Actinoplanes solisilvae TaxID=2486853 RepID=UPI0013E32C5F|nr:FAD-dependent monooxygenase [Actinoplanes solisilvae]